MLFIHLFPGYMLKNILTHNTFFLGYMFKNILTPNIFFPWYMLKNILLHNIFFQGYMDQGFIHTLQPTGSSSGLHQEKGGTHYLFRTFLVFVFVFELHVTGRAPKRRRADGLGNRLQDGSTNPFSFSPRNDFFQCFVWCVVNKKVLQRNFKPFHLPFCPRTYLFYPLSPSPPSPGFFYISENLDFWAFTWWPSLKLVPQDLSL